VPTTGPNTAARIAREQIDRGADLIVAAGGDGTINEVINGMAGSDVPLAILPLGTANVLAKEIGLLGKIPDAAERLASCAPVRIALGRLRAAEAPPRYFLLMAGIGFDAQVVYEVSAGLKNRAGKIAYWFSGFSHVARRLVEFDTRFNGGSLRCSFALASRVRNYGGDFEIATSVTLLDDCFELILFEGKHSTRYLLYLMGLLTGRLAKTKGVKVLRVERADFSAPSDCCVRLQIDGECVGRLPASIEIVPGALTLLVPASYTERANKRTWTTSPIPSLV
jgi:YegS/Rv2252/BmrU family lipid kinase